MGKTILHNFENLEIWKLAIDIADLTYDVTVDYPPEERFGLTSQMNRASVSLSSNIAEGSIGSNNSFSRYLSIALGSSYELQSQLILSKRRKFIKDKDYSVIIKSLNKFQRMTIKFRERILNQN